MDERDYKVMNEELNPPLKKNGARTIRFKKGDIVICWLRGGSYGNTFTVLEDTGGLTLLCHESGSLCIVNNSEDYELA
jgi:hypothetical protein